MTLTAVSLVLISAFMHAGWNYLGKRTEPSPAAFTISICGGCILIVPLLLFFTAEIKSIPAGIWLLLVFSSLCQAIYYYFLSLAYREEDMSIMYPFARAVPVLLVPPLVWLLGQGVSLSALHWQGMGLIVAGCLLLPMQSFGELPLCHSKRTGIVFALLAALGTAGYSIIDHTALEQLRNQFATIVATTSAPFVAATVYIILQACGSACWLLIFVLPQPSERQQITVLWHEHASSLITTGLIVYLTYGLVLAAMSFTEDVSYIVALRQASIPLGALLGVILLKERSCLPKWVGVLLTVTGLVLVSL
ncbi:EamA family transporter [Endozoicomonadaceae bacterium StTr2]